MTAGYDYIVVGGGSAGCVVAGRLARAGAKTLLLEAGPAAEAHPETLRADGYKHAFLNERLMSERFTTPQPGCAGKRLWIGTGACMGGSGSVNGMVYTRGSRQDYDEWPAGWRWDDVTADFTALEAVLRPHRREPTPFTEACVAAAEEIGLRRAQDLNDGDLSGVLGYEWMNYEGDRRRSSYVAFLADGAERESLTVRTGVRVTRLLCRKGVATGVEYVHGGTLRRAEAAGEVVLCAGALETPAILWRSGIGPAASLAGLGLEVVCDAPAIGENLHDHPNVTLFQQGFRRVETFYPQLYGFHRANPALDLPAGQPDSCVVFYPAPSSFREAAQRMGPTLALGPDLHRKRWVRALARGVIGAALASPPARALISRLWGVVVILGKPRSRGRLRLRSADPTVPAEIDPAYFREEVDMATMVEAVARARDLAGRAPLAAWRTFELGPGGRVRSPAAVRRWIARHAMTTFHFAGTCRMGADAAAPVDPALRLRGVDRLRVADASVIPVAPVSALNAPSMLIGWRAATELLGRR